MFGKRKGEVFRVPATEGHWSPDAIKAEEELDRVYNEVLGTDFDPVQRDVEEPVMGWRDVPWWGWVLAVAFFVFICVVPMLTLSTERLNGVPGG